MKLKVQRADPAGNITMFVLSPVEKSCRSEIAAHLLADERFHAEQVAFRCAPEGSAEGRMEMMGGEFCGNATRAFGMLIARERGGLAQVQVETSGCRGPVRVDVDLAAGTARTEMPLPREVLPVEIQGHSCTLVHLGGIAHLVAAGVKPSRSFFDLAEPYFEGLSGLDAYGVIFLNGNTMTPLVKVPAVHSLVWEGSCGSGSLAAAVAQSQKLVNGEFSRSYLQPAGEIRVDVIRREGQVAAALIGGPVTLDPPVELEL